jgi:hypothetical protein
VRARGAVVRFAEHLAAPARAVALDEVDQRLRLALDLRDAGRCVHASSPSLCAHARRDIGRCSAAVRVGDDEDERLRGSERGQERRFADVGGERSRHEHERGIDERLRERGACVAGCRRPYPCTGEPVAGSADVVAQVDRRAHRSLRSAEPVEDQDRDDEP